MSLLPEGPLGPLPPPFRTADAAKPIGPLPPDLRDVRIRELELELERARVQIDAWRPCLHAAIYLIGKNVSRPEIYIGNKRMYDLALALSKMGDEQRKQMGIETLCDGNPWAPNLDYPSKPVCSCGKLTGHNPECAAHGTRKKIVHCLLGRCFQDACACHCEDCSAIRNF